MHKELSESKQNQCLGCVYYNWFSGQDNQNKMYTELSESKQNQSRITPRKCGIPTGATKALKMLKFSLAMALVSGGMQFCKPYVLPFYLSFWIHSVLVFTTMHRQCPWQKEFCILGVFSLGRLLCPDRALSPVGLLVHSIVGYNEIQLCKILCFMGETAEVKK